MFRISIGIMNGDTRPGSFGEQDLVLLLGGVCRPPMPEPRNTPDFVAIGLFEVETGVLERAPSGEDAKVGEAVGAADFLRRRECGDRVEIASLPRRSDSRNAPHVEGW
jgi:hypothetical protein